MKSRSGGAKILSITLLVVHKKHLSALRKSPILREDPWVGKKSLSFHSQPQGTKSLRPTLLVAKTPLFWRSQRVGGKGSKNHSPHCSQEKPCSLGRSMSWSKSPSFTPVHGGKTQSSTLRIAKTPLLWRGWWAGGKGSEYHSPFGS